MNENGQESHRFTIWRDLTYPNWYGITPDPCYHSGAHIKQVVRTKLYRLDKVVGCNECCKILCEVSTNNPETNRFTSSRSSPP